MLELFQNESRYAFLELGSEADVWWFNKSFLCIFSLGSLKYFVNCQQEIL